MLRKKSILVVAMVGIIISGANKTAAEWWPCRYSSDCYQSEYCKKEDGICYDIGSCEPRPEAILCADIGYIPVCGCDNRTYVNWCYAAVAGESVAYEGCCYDGCVNYCMSDGDCKQGEYCAKEIGDCDGIGHCWPPSMIFCIMIIGPPVCGCDGQTHYEGWCFAASGGINTAYEGCCDDCCFQFADFDCDQDVDMIDFSILATAWLTELGDTQWNPHCDISDPADEVIDTLDLAVFADKWLNYPPF